MWLIRAPEERRRRDRARRTASSHGGTPAWLQRAVSSAPQQIDQTCQCYHSVSISAVTANGRRCWRSVWDRGTERSPCLHTARRDVQGLSRRRRRDVYSCVLYLRRANPFVIPQPSDRKARARRWYIFTAPRFHPNWKRRRGRSWILPDPPVQHPSSRTCRRARGRGRRRVAMTTTAAAPQSRNVGGGFAGELAGGGDGTVETRSRGGVGSALSRKWRSTRG